MNHITKEKNTSQEMTLTMAQMDAIAHVGHLGIVAGPGAGKTTILAWRAYHLIQTGQCQPDELVMLTFTNNAAEAMRARITELLDAEAAAAISISTLHAFNMRLIRGFRDLLGYPDANPVSEATSKPARIPQIVSGEQRRAVFVSAFNAALDGAATHEPEIAAILKRLDVDTLRAQISRDKANAIGPEELRRAARTPEQRAHALVFSEYQQRLKAKGLADFDDLVLGAWQLLRMAEPSDFCQGTIRQVFVDEGQDLSRAEWEIVSSLIRDDGGCMTLVADPWQSVHGWRGAIGPDIFNNLQRMFPKAQVMLLNENQRSFAPIVAASNSLLASVGEQRNQVAVRGDGPPIVLLRAASEFEQARVIVSQIKQAVSAGYAGYGEIAIGARTHEQLALIEQQLASAQLPAAMLNHGTFWERGVAKHLRAFLALTQPPPQVDDGDGLLDNLALRTVLALPEIGLSRKSLKSLQGDAPELIGLHLLDEERVSQLDLTEQANLKQWMDWFTALIKLSDAPPDQVVRFVLDEANGIGYARVLMQARDERMQQHQQDDVQRFLRLAEQHECTSAFLDQIELLSGDDPLSNAGQDRVTLATLHALKGLQFKVMIMAGVNEGLLPLYGSANCVSERELLEELRLMHVGMTRAQDVLIMVFTQTRQRADKRIEKAYPSRFLACLRSKLSRYQPLAWQNLLTKAPQAVQAEEALT